MTEPFLSMVSIWANTYAPRSWAFCHGQLLAISSNTALFSLIGTYYGGDGRTTFGLPDLRGRAAVGHFQGPGLSPNRLGQFGGEEFVTLTQLNLPTHSHGATVSPPPGGGSPAAQIGAVNALANADSPTGNALAQANFDEAGTKKAVRMYSDQAPNVDLGGLQGGGLGNVTLGTTGGSQSHENRQPFQVVNFCIALEGIYPSRN